MIHLAELFFMMFPSKPSCSSGISSPATLTKENRTQISHSFYTRISTVSHFTWLNPPPPQKTTETTEGHPGLRLFGQVLGGSGDISSWSWMDSYCLTVLQFYYGTIQRHLSFNRTKTVWSQVHAGALSSIEDAVRKAQRLPWSIPWLHLVPFSWAFHNHQ